MDPGKERETDNKNTGQIENEGQFKKYYHMEQHRNDNPPVMVSEYDNQSDEDGGFLHLATLATDIGLDLWS